MRDVDTVGKATPMRILFASPAWAPSRAFGGPIVAAGELVRRLVSHGHNVDVATTTILDLAHRPAARSHTGVVDGATVHYLGTPLRYRWMGITPTLPVVLARLPHPDVVHIFGFRDPVTTGTAAWCRARRIPYVFEPLGMFRPRLRKVALKHALDSTLYRGVAGGAAAVVVASER
ncbi:MAG: glycosyltransferase, partial [Gaiellaceae bacterium]